MKPILLILFLLICNCVLIYYCTDLFYHDDLENNCVLPKCLIEFCLIILLDLGLLLVASSLNGRERTSVCFWV